MKDCRGSASATHLLRQFPPARRRPSTSSSHSGSASWPRTVCGPAVGRWPALIRRPGGDLLHQRRLGDLAGLPQQQQRQFGDHSGDVVAPAEPMRDRIPQRLGVAGQGPAGARGHQPPSRAAHRAKVAGQIAQHPQLEHVVLAARRVRQRVPAEAADRLDHGWTVRLPTWSARCPAPRQPCQQPAQRGQCLLPAGRTGTGSSGLPANRGSTGSSSARRPHHGCAPAH